MTWDAAQWFILRGRTPIGPLNDRALRDFAQAGRLDRDDLVWREGLDQWVPVEQALPSLFPSRRGAVVWTRESRQIAARCASIVIVVTAAVGAHALWSMAARAWPSDVGRSTTLPRPSVASQTAPERAEVAPANPSQGAPTLAQRVERALDRPENAELKAFLASSGELRLPQPRWEQLRMQWTDESARWNFDPCGRVKSMDPTVPALRARFAAKLDRAAAEAIDNYFGYPVPLPCGVRWSGQQDINKEIDRRIDQALAEHGVESNLSKGGPNWRLGLNHLWLVKRSVPLLRDFANEAVRSFPGMPNQSDRPHDIVAITSLVQAGVPYRLIPARAGWENLGVRSPAMTLLLRGGDCDSKSTLMASLLRAIRPELPIVLINDLQRGDPKINSGDWEPHMLIGIGIAPRQCDTTVRFQGKTYVVIETTGVWGIGAPSEDFGKKIKPTFIAVP